MTLVADGGGRATDWAAEGYTDLGDNHWYKFVGWHPDRDINPQYADIPGIDRCGAFVPHPKPDGDECESGGFIHFDTADIRRVFGEDHVWTVESWDPLTVSPSLLCKACGDHGFIRAGRWVRA